VGLGHGGSGAESDICGRLNAMQAFHGLVSCDSCVLPPAQVESG